MSQQEKLSNYQPSLPIVDEAAATQIRESRLDWFHSIEVGTHITPGMGPGYVENWEFVSEFLRRHANVIEAAHALEPACADGLWTCWLTKLGARHIDATDLGDREQFRLIVRAFALPVAYYPGILSTSLPQTLRNRYDLVCSLGLLYHVHDPLVTLTMYHRYLRPGGWLILETGAIDEAAPYLHYTGAGEIYGREGGNQFLPTLGFLHSAFSELGMTIADQAFRSEGIEDKMGRPAGRAILIAQRTGPAAMYLYQQVVDQLGMTAEGFPPDP